MARYVEYQREMAYRIYVTDELYESADHMRPVMPQRYCEWLGVKAGEDERSGDEIVADIIRKAGLVVE